MRQKIKQKGDINIQVAYTSKKPKSEFQVKVSTDFAHTHNVVYEAICPSDNCTKRYLGKTDRRLGVRAKEHLGEQSHLGLHTVRAGHRPVTLNNFKILSSGFKLPRNQKIAEALLIKFRKPDINVQGVWVSLKLF